MALFFYQGWFKARLEALSLWKPDLALCLGLTREELDEIWKDQREVSRQQVLTLSALLNVDPIEIANRCGIATPVPKDETPRPDRVLDLQRRVEALERVVEQLVASQKAKP